MPLYREAQRFRSGPQRSVGRLRLAPRSSSSCTSVSSERSFIDPSMSPRAQSALPSNLRRGAASRGRPSRGSSPSSPSNRRAINSPGRGVLGPRRGDGSHPARIAGAERRMDGAGATSSMAILNVRVASDGCACAACATSKAATTKTRGVTPDGPRQAPMLVERTSTGTAPCYGWDGKAARASKSTSEATRWNDSTAPAFQPKTWTRSRRLHHFTPRAGKTRRGEPATLEDEVGGRTRRAHLCLEGGRSCSSCHLGDTLADGAKHDVDSRETHDDVKASLTPPLSASSRALRALLPRRPLRHPRRRPPRLRRRRWAIIDTATRERPPRAHCLSRDAIDCSRVHLVGSWVSCIIAGIDSRTIETIRWRPSTPRCSTTR